MEESTVVAWKKVPSGMYKGSIIDHWVQKNTRTGSIELAFKIKVFENLDNGYWKDLQKSFNRLLWIPILPSTLEKWVAPILALLEVGEIDLKRIDSRHPRAFRIKGQVHPFRCAHVSYRDSVSERWYFNLDTSNKLSEEELTELNEIVAPFLKS